MSGTHQTTEPEFRISHESEPSGTLLAGFSTFGLAGLTAVDYLVDQLDLQEEGHLTVEQFPSITPFEDGRPRHHTRLFSREDIDVSVLVGELFVPVSVSQLFAAAIVDWTQNNDVEEVAILSGIPIMHAPDDHRTFYIATDDYRERNLENVDLTPMGSGFLDGTNAALVDRGLDSPLGVGVFVTPVHQQVPDVQAAIRLVEAVNTVYGLDVDTGPLTAFAEQIKQHYSELADRIENQKEELPEDRMYM